MAPGPRRSTLHDESGPATAWTRVNIGEGIPGVSTPLTWSFWEAAIETGIQGAYLDLGVISKIKVPPREPVDGRLSGVFYGRPAINVDLSRRYADLQPGLSGDALEQHFFGSVRPGVHSETSRRRYPLVFTRGAFNAVRGPREMRRQFDANLAWWQGVTAPDRAPTVEEARADFREAARRFELGMRWQSTAGFVAGADFQQLAGLAGKAERLDLLMALGGGFGSVDLDTAADLWDVSRGGSTLDDFLRTRGYQGPLQGEMSASSWREDPAPVRQLVTSMQTLGPEHDPRAATRDREAERQRAERQLLGALPKKHQPWARFLLLGNKHYGPMREIGKAQMMMSFDAARASARVLGRDLVARDVIEQTDDVFYLTTHELLDAVPRDAAARVAERRAERAGYLAVDIPESWVGIVEPIDPATVAEGEPDVVTGAGVSPGVAEGAARVIGDATDPYELEPGEVLVCETTDPAYAPYFVVASAVVIDIGGAMSHGAVLAREMGIPCVIGTKVGTGTLRTGDLLRVDGGTGRVDVLKRAPS